MQTNPLSELLKFPAQDRADLAIALWESLNEAERESALELTPNNGPSLTGVG